MPTVRTPIIDKNGVLTSRNKNTTRPTTSTRIPTSVPSSKIGYRSPSQAQDLENELIDKHKTLRLTLNGDDASGRVSIGYIAVPLVNRGVGVGSRALEDIVGEADRNGWTLTVTPSQEPQAKRALLIWYGRYGFEANDSWKEGDAEEEMMRTPR